MVVENVEKSVEEVDNVGDAHAACRQFVPMTKQLQEHNGGIATASSFLYFSYGSNMLAERINVNLPGSTFLSVAMLPAFELCFFDQSNLWHGALASIERHPSAHVWGCVWRVPTIFSAALDEQERLYHRLDVNVLLVPSTIGVSSSVADDPSLSSTPPAAAAAFASLECLTYQYSNPDRKPTCPSPHYKQVIVAGAIEHRLPPVYVDWLINNFPTNGYQGSVRLNLEAIRHLNNGGMANDEEHAQQQLMKKNENGEGTTGSAENGTPDDGLEEECVGTFVN